MHWGRQKRVCMSIVASIALVGLVLFLALFPASFIYVEYDQVRIFESCLLDQGQFVATGTL